MIIVLGADMSGKTTLAKELSSHSGLPYYHFVADSKYEDYLNPLVSLEMHRAVCDRFILCEFPYSKILGRKFQFTMKEIHNVMLLALMQKPVFILCTHKPTAPEYSKETYLPYEKWDMVLSTYRKLLDVHKIQYMEYDYAKTVVSIDVILKLEERYSSSMDWWIDMHRKGYGATGSPNPDFLLVAERLGPNNIQNLPFSHGPTGHMLSDMLARTNTPLGKFAVTNMVKSFRRDPRPPNEQDKEFLRTELEHLKPRVAVFMGSVSQNSGMKIAKDMGIKTASMVHFGYYSHRGIYDVSMLSSQWQKIINIKEADNEQTGHRTIISST